MSNPLRIVRVQLETWASDQSVAYAVRQQATRIASLMTTFDEDEVGCIICSSKEQLRLHKRLYSQFNKENASLVKEIRRSFKRGFAQSLIERAYITWLKERV